MLASEIRHRTTKLAAIPEKTNKRLNQATLSRDPFQVAL